MASRSFCLVCGASDSEVKRMHYFPAKLESSKIWQENMRMKYSGDSLRNYRICSRHFEDHCYLGSRLQRGAVPTLYSSSGLTTSTTPSTASASMSAVPMSIDAPGSGYDEPLPASGASTSTTDVTISIKHASSKSSCSTTDVGGGTNVVNTMKESLDKPRPVRRSLFKGIPNLSRIESTPRKLHLMDLILKKENHIRKLKRVCKKRGQDIKSLQDLTDTDVVRNIFKGISQTTSDFLIAQLKCAKRKPTGRRWTTDEKVVALAIYKKGPKCYNFLRKIIALPSRRTLLALLEKVPFSVGINFHLFEHINNSITRAQDRICVLLFDEMDIKENLSYLKGADRIAGFEDLGTGVHTNKIANKALVFMCQGVATGWKQPIAYYFCNGTCRSEQLVKCLKEVLHAAIHVGGLDVIATICDMGSNNVKALKDLGITMEQPYFNFEDRKVFVMHDPPHLLKCTVSLFRKHNVSVPVVINDEEDEMEAQFQHIVQAHNIDKKSPYQFRSMRKIKDVHLAPVMRFAMKVSLAGQVMSRTVAAFLYVLLSREEIDYSSIATATFVEQVDTLFDSFNGSQLTPGDKEVKCVITKNSAHLAYWNKAIEMVNKWQYLRVTKTGALMEGKPPSQIGWMISINAIREIWNYVEKKGFTHLRPRTLNQDSLENLFGAIRGGCGCADNPTASQFEASLKTQILNGLTSRGFTGGNCEVDENVLLTNLHEFINVGREKGNVTIEEGVTPLEGPDSTLVRDPTSATDLDPSEALIEEITRSVTAGSTEVMSVAYVSGFIATVIFKKVNCDHCKGLLTSSSTDPHNLFISFKEWTATGEKLTYPSENLVVFVGAATTHLETFIPSYGNKPGITSAAAIKCAK